MRGLVKYIMGTAYKPLLTRYLSKTRMYSYEGIHLQIPPQVFHPGFFFSTKLLLRYISKDYLSNKTFLELGAGSGLLSIYAAKQGAFVTASDISSIALECLKTNAEENFVEISIVHSNLFDDIPHQQFDFILINPPYYKKKPLSAMDYAWYCGENGEYFQNLFKHLNDYMQDHSNVLMVLCDGCDIQFIETLAKESSFHLNCVHVKKTLVERNYIFKIESMK